jgi:hypothetical protein
MVTQTASKYLTLDLRYNQDESRWEAWAEQEILEIEGPFRWKSVRKPILVLSTTEVDDFMRQVRQRTASPVLEEIGAEVTGVVEELAKQVPYPQDCQCEHFPTHIANDCHEHNENPRHFIGDFDLDCSCP